MCFFLGPLVVKALHDENAVIGVGIDWANWKRSITLLTGSLLKYCLETEAELLVM